MSIIDELFRIRERVYESYMAAQNKGAGWPTEDGSFPIDKLPDMIGSIPYVDMSDVWTISVEANDPSLGDVYGNGFVSAGLGALVTVAAVPSGNAKFVGWQENSVIVETDEIYTFSLGGHRALVALFEEDMSSTGPTVPTIPTVPSVPTAPTSGA